jgi:hypothetical protein
VPFCWFAHERYVTSIDHTTGCHAQNGCRGEGAFTLLAHTHTHTMSKAKSSKSSKGAKQSATSGLGMPKAVIASEEDAMWYVQEMRLSLTGARIDDVIVGRHNINRSALFRVVGADVRPCRRDLDALRAFPKTVWPKFLQALQRFPFFAAKSIKEREAWLRENESDSGAFIGDDDLEEARVVLIQPGEPSKQKKDGTPSTPGLCDLESETIEKLATEPTHPRAIERMCSPNHVTQATHPVLLFKKHKWRLDEGATPLADPARFSGVVIDVTTGRWFKKEAAEEEEEEQKAAMNVDDGDAGVAPSSSSSSSWYVVSIGSSEVALAVPATCNKRTDLGEAALPALLRQELQLGAGMSEAEFATLVSRCVHANRGLTSAGFKSLLQKLIRFQPHAVQLEKGAPPEQHVPADVALAVAFCMELNHKGSFVPDIQRFVSGVESATKRLPVTIFEDSAVEVASDAPKALVSLLAAAKLAQCNYAWFPSRSLIVQWLRLALEAQRCSLAWRWKIERGKEIKPFTIEEVGTGKVGKTRAIANPAMAMCSALLDNLRSFAGDLAMVRDIATLAWKETLDMRAQRADGQPFEYTRPPLGERLVMPLCHCVDYHWTTDFAFWLDPQEVERLGSDAVPRPFASVFSEIWQQSSSLNPRRAGRYDTKHPGTTRVDATFYRGVAGYTYLSQMVETHPFVAMLREAQWLLLQTKRDAKQRSRAVVEDTPPYELEYKLDCAWLSALAGPMEVKVVQEADVKDETTGKVIDAKGTKTILVCLRVSNPYELVAMRKPQRGIKTRGLSTQVAQAAVQLARKRLVEEGVTLRAARAPIPALAEKTLFLVVDAATGRESYTLMDNRDASTYRKRFQAAVAKPAKRKKTSAAAAAKPRKKNRKKKDDDEEEEKEEEEKDGDVEPAAPAAGDGVSARAIQWDEIQTARLRFPIHERLEDSWWTALATTGTGVVRDFDAAVQALLESTSLKHLRRSMTFLNGCGSEIRMNRLSREGRGLKHAVSVYDVGAFQFLMRLSMLAPAALRPVVGPTASPGVFRVDSGPLMWTLRDRIRSFLTRENSSSVSSSGSSSSSSEAGAGWERFSFLDRRERVLRPYQVKCVEELIELHQLGRSVKFLWQAIGSGKCWGLNTKLFLFDGRVKLVQDIRVGDVLMGDDNTPRTVLSISEGDTGADASAHDAGPKWPAVKHGHERGGVNDVAAGNDGRWPCKWEGCDARPTSKYNRIVHEARAKPHQIFKPVPATYRITSKNLGRESWTCNGAHILVLKFNLRPSGVFLMPQRGFACSKPFYFWDLRVTENGSKVVKQSQSFATREEAQSARDEADERWTPLIWECTVDQFMACCSVVRLVAQMFQPDAVQFQSKGRSLKQQLTAQLRMIKGQEDRTATDSETELTAWVLGLWLTDGCKGTANISQIKSDRNRPEHSHEPIVAQLKHWYRIIMLANPGDDDQPPEWSAMSDESAGTGVSLSSRANSAAKTFGGIVRFEQYSTCGNTVYKIRMGPLFSRLLRAYGIFSNKEFPHDLLADTHSVRMKLLEGVVDGDGYTDIRRSIEVSAKNRAFLDGLVHLVRGLGFSTGKVGKTSCVSKYNGKTHTGHRIHISGRDLHQIKTVLMYKRAPVRRPNKDPRCDGFTVEKIPHQKYFGFTLSGNGRCLMGDFVVTHNVSRISNTRRLRIWFR